MNHYPFPYITHLNGVLDAIEGHPEFIVAERDGYKVVNYLVSTETSFPEINTVSLTNGETELGPIYEQEEDQFSAIRRELRGMIFDSNGNLISRRYHKFFNIGEREETLPNKIDLSLPHKVLIKMDGSMISFINVNGEVKATTKMGVTDVAEQAQKFIQDKPQYINIFNDLPDFTVIFEWCSRKQKIVIDYPVDQLVLTAVRSNYFGTYMSFEELEELGKKYDIPVVKSYPSSDLDTLMSKIKSETSIEGVVIRFDDGHMLKLKADLYVKMHHARDALVFEKNVVSMLLDASIDDIKSHLPMEELAKLVDFENKFLFGIDQTVSAMIPLVDNTRKSFTKKEFALGLGTTMNPLTRSIFFSLWDSTNLKEDVMEKVIEIIKKNTSSSSGIDKVRYLWNHHKWNYSFQGDN